MKHKNFSGYLFALGATALWSGNFIVARGLNDSIPPISLAFWRWLVAVIVFLPLALKPLIVERNTLARHFPYLSITSLMGITVFNTLIYFAAHTTTAINLSLISITFPVFIVILVRFFFKEPLTANKGAGIVFVATGVVLLITKGDVSSLLEISFAVGDVWMLLAAIIFAVYSILLKNKPVELSVWALQLCTFILGLVFLLPFYTWERMTHPPIEFDAAMVGSILYVGIFASLSAFVLWNKAVMTLGPSKAGMVYYTLPLFSGFLAWLLLKENIGPVHFYSAFLIVPGIFIANYERSSV